MGTVAKRTSSRGLIRDILEMESFTKDLIGKGKEYENLLKFLISLNNEGKDAFIDIPKMKVLQEELKLTYIELRKQLNEIYKDLLEDANEGNWQVKEVEYVFDLKSFGEYLTLTLKSIPVIPRVGEDIEIPFFKEKLRCTSFYVESINHFFTDKKQIVTIQLSKGWNNKYWAIRKDEAELKGEITINEKYDFDDYQKKEKLGLNFNYFF